MRRPLRSTWIPLLLLGLTPPSVAQDVCFDGADAATLWVRGSTYKARFDEGGASFVPYLGAHAPRHRPLGLRLERVSVGVSELELERSVSPVREGERVSFERGALTELYHVRTDGVEQAFRFDAPLGAGALSIRIALETDLTARAHDGGVRFECELGGVQYGRATAIDAAGRRSDAPVSLEGDTIVIRVAEEFLVGAAWPVLVDPLISSFAIDDSPAEDRYADVAYDASLDVYAVCWQRTFSANDHDVYGKLLDASGATLDTFAIDISGNFSAKPKVAGIAALDEFLVAYFSPSLSGESVATRRLHFIGGALVIEPPVPHLPWAINIDLGGDSGSEPPYRYCLIAGQHLLGYRTAYALILQPNGQVFNSIRIGSGSWQVFEPRISKTARGPLGQPRAWGLQYESSSGGAPRDVYAGTLRSNAAHNVRLVATDVYESVCVSSPLEGEGVDLPVLSISRSAISGTCELYGRVVRDSLVETPLQLLVDAPVGTPDGAAVDSDGSSFVLVHSGPAGGTMGPGLLASTYQLSSGMLHLVEREPLSPSIGITEGDPALTSTRSGGGAPQRFLAAWHEVSGADHDIHGAIYDTPGVGESYCDGAPNSVGAGARIHATGSISIALNQMTLVVEGCPPGLPGMFFLGVDPTQVPFGEGFRCIASPTRRIQPVLTVDPSGAASLQLDFDQPYGALVQPGSPGVNYQFWYRDPAGGPAAFNLSDALHVEHTP